jgi:hypothetical protein
MRTSDPSKDRVQLVWAGALIFMGIAVFFRIPQILPKLVEMGHSATTVGFIRVCFYIIGCLLVGGGIKKLMHQFKANQNETAREPKNKDI